MNESLLSIFSIRQRRICIVANVDGSIESIVALPANLFEVNICSANSFIVRNSYEAGSASEWVSVLVDELMN